MNIKYTETDHKKYPYVLLEDVYVDVENFPNFDHEYFQMANNRMCLYTGYAIDGVTAYPDLDGLMPGAFVHDALLQAIDAGLMPESYRSKTHKVFYDNCDKSTWYKRLSARVAYTGLKLFHDLYHKVAG